MLSKYFSLVTSSDDGITTAILQFHERIHSSYENYTKFLISSKIQFITHSKLYYTLGFLLLLYSKICFISKHFQN